ncbi:MAG: discoidin domain-containing protein, partial [Coriobacteriia bacterium]|nr:discoidin domain-containing protein [Coriobacteriia bacterium]
VHADAAGAPCAVCHASSPRVPDVTAKTAECASCHATSGSDYHRDMATQHTYADFGPSCIAAGCHVSGSLPAEHTRFLSRYPAYSDTCALCHLNTDPARIDWDTASADCSTCHEVHGDIGVIHQAPNSATCTACHETPDVRTIHAGSPLGECAVCHNNPSRVPTLPATVDCAYCHDKAPVDTKHYPAAPHLASESGCANCHLLDMKAEHVKPTVNVTCVQCHETEVDAFTQPWDKRCMTCHSTRHGDKASKHVSTNTACSGSGCHSITDASDIHKGVQGGGCSVCHKSATSLATTTDCTAAGCHQGATGDHHASHDGQAANGVGCEGCHFRYLDDEHESLGYTCATCHSSTNTVVKNAITANDRRCLTCHPDSAHNQRQAAEFAPGNASMHRVRSDLPGMRSSFVVNGSTYTWSLPSASSFLKSGYAVNSIVTCDSCHTYSGTTGPHGATMKVNVDPAYPNPYKVVDGSESFTAQLSANSPTGMSMSKSGSSAAKIICEKCHDLNGSGSNFSNNAHAEHDDRGREGSFCNQCHVAIPHGWGRPRLLGYTTDPAAYRTWVGTSGAKDGGLARITLKSYTPNNWQKSDCGAGCSSSRHPFSGTTWPNQMAAPADPNMGGVSGKVTDQAGASVSAATVTIGGTTATTGTDGMFSVANLAAGTHSVTVAKSGYTTWTGSVSVTSGANTTLNVQLQTANVATNWALTGTATASSSYSSGTGPSRAIDGSTSSYWRSQDGNSAWLRVDLGSSRSVSKVVINWDDSRYAKDYRVETSPDGTNWTTRFSTTSASSGTKTHTFSAVEVRYVRLTCTSANDSHYRVIEFETWSF